MPPELLAPARDAEHGMLAVNAGADAVYIGVGPFSARKKAGCDVPDIARLVDYAHRFKTRVYGALNTLLFDRELPQAAALLRQLHEAGIDGAIIQDMGLLEMDLPPLPLIASTQTHNTTVAQVRFLERAGFARVILARELSIQDIQHIRQQTHIPLEAFVHGALCVSFSGRCYLSFANGGRSANRGDCAQPCRKPYHLLDGDGRLRQTGHLLSLMDLNRIHLLGDLLDAGVTSFKIEGRLKDATYLVNTVAAYRRALDKALELRGIESFTDELYTGDLSPDPAAVFNRGFVTGFAQGQDRMAGFDTPKAIGAPLGHVASLQGRIITLNNGTTVVAGDGLCYFAPDGTLTGTRVEAVNGDAIRLLDAGSLRLNTALFRNRDQARINALKSNPVHRRVPVDLSLSGTNGVLRLCLSDQQGTETTERLEETFEPPDNPEAAAQRWHRQLKKSGDTEFVIRHVRIDAPTLPMWPVARINALRRTALDELRQKRIQSLPSLCFHPPEDDAPAPTLTSLEAGNICNQKALDLYHRMGVTETEPAPEFRHPGAVFRLMTCRYCLRRELRACLVRPEGASLKGPLFLQDVEGGDLLELVFDCEACEMHVTRPASR